MLLVLCAVNPRTLLSRMSPAQKGKGAARFQREFIARLKEARHNPSSLLQGGDALLERVGGRRAARRAHRNGARHACMHACMEA